MLTLPKYTPLHSYGWNGLCADTARPLLQNIDDFLELPDKKVILDAPCRTVTRFNTPIGPLYAKLMWAQNDQALQEHLLHKWLKWAFGRSRALIILKNTSAMLAQGHLCPLPLLATRKRRSNGWHLNLLVTTEVSAPTVEELLLNTPEEEEALQIAQLAGEKLARLHQDNFVHGDFLPRNTCLNRKTNEFYFLDNDKTSHFPLFPAPFFLKRRNLDQFAYNLLKLKALQNNQELGLQLAQNFLLSYANTTQLPHFKPLQDAILAKASLRLKRRTKG